MMVWSKAWLAGRMGKQQDAVRIFCTYCLVRNWMLIHSACNYFTPKPNVLQLNKTIFMIKGWIGNRIIFPIHCFGWLQCCFLEIEETGLSSPFIALDGCNVASFDRRVDGKAGLSSALIVLDDCGVVKVYQLANKPFGNDLRFHLQVLQMFACFEPYGAGDSWMGISVMSIVEVVTCKGAACESILAGGAHYGTFCLSCLGVTSGWMQRGDSTDGRSNRARQLIWLIVST